jgi:hypothetical protein
MPARGSSEHLHNRAHGAAPRYGRQAEGKPKPLAVPKARDGIVPKACGRDVASVCAEGNQITHGPPGLAVLGQPRKPALHVLVASLHLAAIATYGRVALPSPLR